MALGTVADCVSLGANHNNRAVVRYGLRMIAAGRRPSPASGAVREIRRHAMAAGLTIRRDDIEGFLAAFSVAVGQKLDSRALSPVLWSDGDIEPSEITDELLSALDDMEPWGRGFEPPVFGSEFTVLRARAVGEDGTHLSMTLRGSGRAFGALGFRALAPGEAELPMPGETLRLLYTPGWNWWRGERRIRVVVEGCVVA